MTTITHFSSEQIEKHLNNFANMLKLTVDNGASIGWIPPITEDEAKGYWQDVSEQVKQGNKILIVALQDDTVVGAV